MLGSFRATFKDKITRYDDTGDGSCLLTVKVKKLIFPKWRLLTGLDMWVDPNSTDTICTVSLSKGGDRSRTTQLKWLRDTVEYAKWTEEVAVLNDYLEHTTYKSTEKSAEPCMYLCCRCTRTTVNYQYSFNLFPSLCPEALSLSFLRSFAPCYIPSITYMW